MTVLVTGAAGFIGFHVSTALLRRGERVIGVDNLNDYYDVTLKEARLAELRRLPGFAFHRLELAERGALQALLERHPDTDRIIHLAAQAGVRYSLTNPHAYIGSNIQGHLEVLEACRALPRLKHLVYASSSSVYGGNTKLPFSVADRVDTPHSLYAATKKADELMSYCYAHLYRLPTTGLRFFTVYGPWGRPDMAAWLFTDAILAGKPIQVFNHGDMRRDFTFIDDIVAGVLAAHDRIDRFGYRVWNLGSDRPVRLDAMITAIARVVGKEPRIRRQPMQPGDVDRTWADLTRSRAELGYQPSTPFEDGLSRQWTALTP
jgi:UDP-glucuronate 4-epimerase